MEFQQAIKDEKTIDEEKQQLEAFISCNPQIYLVYSILGQYFEMLGHNEEAIKYYNLALTKEVASLSEKQAIQQRIESCKDE